MNSLVMPIVSAAHHLKQNETINMVQLCMDSHQINVFSMMYNNI